MCIYICHLNKSPLRNSMHSTKTMWPSSSSSSSSPYMSQVFYSRRLLLHTPHHHPPGEAAPPTSGNGHESSGAYMGDNSFDANVVMILSVLLCALICALGLNSIIRCALRCSSRVVLDSSDTTAAARLANTGVKRKALKTFPIVTYSAGLKQPGLDTECIICLSEFAPGERLRILPKCHHGFHARCIDKWLMAHSSCPTCRHCLISTCQKIVSCNQSSSSQPPATSPPPTPLDPEGLIRIYRGIG